MRDPSGGVLPGVTVTAESAALIERVRTAVTDGSGQYRIDDLRPGAYVVTFSLSGFTTVRREGLELSGSFAASVNVEMGVGALNETITVSGESPVVDVVNARQQRILDNEVIAAIPTARLYHSLVTLVPGVTTSGRQDVGGTAGPLTVTFSMRGGPGNEGRLTVDGLSLGGSMNGSGVSYTVGDVGNAQEVVFSTSSGLGEAATAGPAMNLVPRTGGNRFSGTFFANGATGALQGNNFTDEIRNAGLATPARIEKIWDVNGSAGGPILRDRVWFFSAVRHQGNHRQVGGIQRNLNAGKPNAWTYVPDPNSRVSSDSGWKSVNTRITLQATQRNKLNLYWDEQRNCTSCSDGGNATTSPEARGNNQSPPRVLQATWTSPATTRLLFEAGWGSNLTYGYGPVPNLPNSNQLIQVVEQCTAGCAANGNIPGLTYRNNEWYVADGVLHNWRAAATYATGAHNFKVGYQGQFIDNRFPNARMNDQWLRYRVNNGIPNQLTMIAGPREVVTFVTATGLYAQDQWKMNRLTVSGAVRYDNVRSRFPEQQLGPSQFFPDPITYAPEKGVAYHDITPRMEAAYDLFGTGKTALKMSFGKYLVAVDGSSITGSVINPLSRISTNTTRTWTDANGNFVPDCDLRNPNAQDLTAAGGDFCGLYGNLNFGKEVFNTTYDPDILSGWGKREYDWNLAIQVQQELLPRVSVEVGYFRRWFGNQFVTDNRATTADDYDTWSFVAPADPRLPGGGGQTITGLYNVRPALSGVTDNYQTFSKNYGGETRRWDSVEVNFNARTRQGLNFQGGTSTGRVASDECHLRAILPETNTLNPYCRSSLPFLTQFKGLGSYTIPKIDVQLSGTIQNIPGGNLAANYAVTTAQAALSLGRPLSGNATNATVNLIQPGMVQNERINQLDFRVSKILRFAGTRAQFAVDLYNALNANPIETYNATFTGTGIWPRPTGILEARFIKLTTQFTF